MKRREVAPVNQFNSLFYCASTASSAYRDYAIQPRHLELFIEFVGAILSLPNQWQVKTPQVTVALQWKEQPETSSSNLDRATS